MQQYLEVILFFNEWLVKTIDVMIFPDHEEAAGVLYAEHLWILVLLVSDLCLIVYLDRTLIVYLNGKSQCLNQSDWRLGQNILRLLYCQ